MKTVLGIVACVVMSFGVAVAAPLDESAKQARLVQGTFASASDQQSFQRAMSKAFGGEVRITATPQGEGAGFDNFGSAVALSGDTALLSTRKGIAGSVYVFVRNGTAWMQQARLVPSDVANGDFFGTAVALFGDTALVGASQHDTPGGVDAGSAYVFTRAGTAWTQQAQLTASDGADDDRFGVSVALSGDTALVGAFNDETPAGFGAGSAYVFTRSGSTWVQQDKLVAADAAPGDSFGVSVALSGESALVGADADQNATGAAYVFTRTNTLWAQQAKLTALDGAQGDQFGSSIALSGDTALVGALADDTTAGGNAGSAYVFSRGGTIWTQQDKLIAADGAADDLFGLSVALSGDTAIVGAPRNDGPAGTNVGSAYAFTRSGTAWTQQSQFTAGDGAAEDEFGNSVAVSGDTSLVGAPVDDTTAGVDAGTAHVFTRANALWSLQAQLTLGDGAVADAFGISVALSNDTALVGAELDDTLAGVDVGSAYVFTRSNGAWIQQAKFGAADGAANDRFGRSVALSGDTALVGAYAGDTSAGLESGAAYAFTRSGTVWTQQAKLLAADGAVEDYFGYSVALSDDTALIGAYLDDTPGGGVDAGSAYVFTRSGALWTQQARLFAGDGAAFDQFGISVALEGQTALVGANKDNTAGGVDSGSAYVFFRSGGLWAQQARLTADDGGASDQFGVSVALSGDTALVGANRDNTPAGFETGSAYVFSRSGTAWTQQAKLTAGDGSAFDQFGIAVALSGDTALVGADADDVPEVLASNRGSAYVYTRNAAVWTQQTKLVASDATDQAFFGSAVALSGDTALVGATRVDTVYAFVNRILIFRDGFEQLPAP